MLFTLSLSFALCVDISFPGHNLVRIRTGLLADKVISVVSLFVERMLFELFFECFHIVANGIVFWRDCKYCDPFHFGIVLAARWSGAIQTVHTHIHNRTYNLINSNGKRFEWRERRNAQRHSEFDEERERVSGDVISVQSERVENFWLLKRVDRSWLKWCTNTEINTQMHAVARD